ncbi:MAG: hypothetical protein L3K19_02770 [Thermoplasmata archaeon]|nr:hypothetical protein [Thermoplasmata archaeon]
MESERIIPEPQGWLAVRRILTFSLLPVAPLVALVFGGLSLGYGVQCSSAECADWPALALGAAIIVGIAVLALLGGDSLPQSIWVGADGVSFGWRSPGPTWEWSEMLGPQEAPRWGIVPILRRRAGRRPKVAGVVTTAQARSLVLDPRFPSHVLSPWCWESLGLVPPSAPGIGRPIGPRLGPAGTLGLSVRLSPVRFELREARVRARRHRVMVWFTAPGITGIVGVVGWASTGELGVGLALLGASMLVWNFALRILGRRGWPPEALWVTGRGLRFESQWRGTSTVGGLVPWSCVTIYPSRVGERERYFVRYRPRVFGEASAFVRLPEGAVSLLLGANAPVLPPSLVAAEPGLSIPVSYPVSSTA